MKFTQAIPLLFTILSSTAMVEGYVDVRYFDIGTGHGNVPAMEGMTPHSTSRIGNIDFHVGDGALSQVGSSLHDFVGAIFEGCIAVPHEGQWTFYTESDDGSNMYVNDVQVVNNDGLHPMQERGGNPIFLPAGQVRAKVTFFENGGNAGLRVKWSGPTVAKQIISSSSWVPCSTDAPTNFPTPPPTNIPTNSPTETTTDSPTRYVPPPTGTILTRPPGGGAHGDPHLVTWSGEKYDFHGICDLVLLTNPGFEENKGLDIHIRTHKLQEWSYVEASTIRIGNDVLEVIGGKDNMNKLIINGIIHEFENTSNGVEEMLAISGYPIFTKVINNKAQEIAVDLGGGEKVIFRTWNSFVSIKVENPSDKHFGSSLGLMGSFPSGKKIARDNKTIFDDVNEFGQEWQVNGDEPKLFHAVKGPQFPQTCEIPSSIEMRRRLATSKMTVERAETACAKVEENLKDLCIFDVMASSDESVSGAY